MAINQETLKSLIVEHSSVKNFELVREKVDVVAGFEKFRVILNAEGPLPALIDAAALAKRLESKEPMVVTVLRDSKPQEGMRVQSTAPDRIEFDGTFEETRLKLSIRLSQ